MSSDPTASGPTMLYVVIHARVATPTRLITHDAARRNIIGDLFVVPPRPVKVGMLVQLVEIRATNEAVLDGSKNRIWRIIPGVEVRGRVVGFRAHERSSVEFVIANGWESMWDSGISCAYITVQYNAGETARLGAADRLVRASLWAFRILPHTRKLTIIPMEAFNKLAVTDDTPPHTPTLALDASAQSLFFPSPPATTPPPRAKKTPSQKPTRLEAPSPIPPLPESITLSKSYNHVKRTAQLTRGSLELPVLRVRPATDDEEERSSIASAAMASTEEDTFRFKVSA